MNKGAVWIHPNRQRFFFWSRLPLDSNVWELMESIPRVDSSQKVIPLRSYGIGS